MFGGISFTDTHTFTMPEDYIKRHKAISLTKRRTNCTITSNMNTQTLLSLLLAFLCTLSYHNVNTSPTLSNSPNEIKTAIGKQAEFVASDTFSEAAASPQATNRAGPLLKIYPNSTPNQAPSGSPYILTCKGERDHPNLFTDLRWEDPKGQVIKQGARLSAGSLLLQFDKPTMEDSGEYTCKGSFQKSTMLSAKTKVEFFNEITMECPEHQSIIEGQSDQTIVCKVSAQPSPTVEWTKDGKSLSSYSGRYDFQEGRIIINHPVNKDDAGEYVVTATVLENGRMKVRSIVTEVYTAPKIIPSDMIEHRGAKLGEIEMFCKAEGYPAPRISWFDPSKRNLSSESGYIVNPETGSLKITSLQTTDNGTFECAAQNPVGLAKTSFNLFVGVKPEILTFENKTVDENGSVDLECRSYGNPSPKIEIRLNGQQPLALGHPNVDKVETNIDGDTTVQRIRLRKVPKTFDSLYYCSSTNFAGQVERTGQLKVRFAPDLSGTPRDQWIKPGKLPVVSCFVRAHPEPRISWFKDNILLTNTDYEMSVDPSLNTHSLTIKPHQSGTLFNVYGIYRCQATNTIGENAINIDLRQAHRPSPIEYIELFAAPTHVQVTIQAPQDDGGMHIKFYHIYYTGESKTIAYRSTHRGNQTFSYTVQDKNTRKSGPYILNHLQPDLHYTILVTAENDVGRSDSVKEFHVSTPESSAPDPPVITIPDQPLGVSLTKPMLSKFSNGYRLTWAPPAYDNGEPIDDYVIRYYEAQYMDAKWSISNKSADLEIVHDKVRSERADILDLKPSTPYIIEVRARNKKGTSAPAKILITTLPANGPSLNPHDPAASFLFDMSPSNGIVILVIIILVLILLLVDVTCCWKHQVGALSIMRSWCCSSVQKDMVQTYTET